jgi:hypothetical protein
LSKQELPEGFESDPYFIMVRDLIKNRPRMTIGDDGKLRDEKYDHTVSVFVEDSSNLTAYRAIVEATKRLLQELDEQFRRGDRSHSQKLTCIRFSREKTEKHTLLHCGFWAEDDSPIILTDSVN